MGHHQQVSFNEFEENFIKQPDGYLTVWSSLGNPKEDSDCEESDEPEEVKAKRLILKLDMVNPSRFSDGKTKFIWVEISTKEQYQKSIDYLRKTKELLSESLERNLKSGEDVLEEVELG